MAVRLLFRISVLLVLTQMLHRTVTQQCTKRGGYEVSILGWMLQKHIYDTMFAELPDACLIVCRKDDRCQSFNYVIALSMCEFSNRTKEARPEDFIPNPDRFYFRRDINRVSLGSIPELPAETCKEIKASEGEQAVSKKYWLSNIKPRVPVLAYCDMKTEDVNECSVSPSFCDVNANCQNNKGSYLCSCKVGFTGDGKTCKDINECSASPSVCDVNANCQNNEGSYVCSCKEGFTGDGNTCNDINECSISPSVCDAKANCQNNKGSYLCSCKEGFTGDGKTCNDVNECSISPSVCDVNAICRNSEGSYVCSCKVGYTGNGKTCKDINECSASPSVCDVNANCQNNEGSYVCSCKVGYTGNGKTCKGCPSGWVTREDFCYLISGSSTGKRSEARQTCQQLEGDLPIIRSADENTFLLELVKTQTPVPERVWIGLHRKADTKFYWLDDTPLEGHYNNWGNGEPNNSGGNEDCGQMNPTGPSVEKWNDCPCDWDVSPSVVCQKAI